MKKNTPIFLLLILVIVGVGYYLTTYNKKTSDKMMESDKTPMVEKQMEADDMMDDAEEMMVEGYMDISPAEAKKMIDENPDLVIIDVSPKYDEGHIPGAVNYYVGDGSLDAAITNLEMDADYLVYCHVDSASILGAQKLVDAGFKNVYRLEGNYAAWVDAGYAVEK